MLSKVPPAFKFALPFTLLASPLLLAAAQPVDLETYGVYCNDPSTTALQLSAANVSDRSTHSQSTAPSNAAVSMNASVRSQRQTSIFSSDRWPAALRLLLSNPYAQSPAASHPQPTAASAESNCLAATGELSASSAVERLSSRRFLLSSASQIAQASGELPDLSGPSPTQSPAIKPPAAETPTIIEPESPAAEMPAKLPTVESPAARPLPPSVPSTPQPTVEPAPPPTAAPASPSDLPLLSPSPSLDPSNFTPTTVNPTPFDGKAIKTLAALSDGNYRYLSGEAEDRVYTHEELQQRGGSVFVFKKEGNVVTGNLLPRIGLPGICVTGIASGNRVSGEAYPDDRANTVQQSDRNIGDFEQPGNGALQISQPARTASGGLYYAGAILDLSNFSMINAGSSLPPASCNIGRMASRSEP